jgi:hypothetical protein
VSQKFGTSQTVSNDFDSRFNGQSITDIRNSVDAGQSGLNDPVERPAFIFDHPKNDAGIETGHTGRLQEGSRREQTPSGRFHNGKGFLRHRGPGNVANKGGRINIQGGFQPIIQRVKMGCGRALQNHSNGLYGLTQKGLIAVLQSLQD